MDRAVPLLVALVALAALAALAGCAKSKSSETTGPAPATSVEAGAAPARTAQQLLCRDGLHRRGDHWKKDCNPCRCGADGEIVCSEFPCPAPMEAGPADGGAHDAAR
jgi:hypothetical protein